MQGNLSLQPFNNAVKRYLDALSNSSSNVRRRERSNCRNLLKFMGRSEARCLEPSLVEAWLDALHDSEIELRQKRLSTVRRLLAMTPGNQAEILAEWIDVNRDRLVGSNGKVILLHRHINNAQEESERYMNEAERLYQSGASERAGALARRALKTHASCLRALALLGVLDLEGSRPDLALKRFREALVLSGDPSERNGNDGVAAVLDGLGRTLMAVDHLDEAFEVYSRLRAAGPRWDTLACPILGRIALMRDEPEVAAEWFQHGDPINQFNAFMARCAMGEPFRAFIAFCRGVLANPFVPPELLQRAERRFRDSYDPALFETLDESARAYALGWGDLWIQWPHALRALGKLWDHPTIRTYLIRALPIARRDPASPRLAVLVHACALQLKKDDAAVASIEGYE
jgi:tetratricopeptide (TPR) repeat protein